MIKKIFIVSIGFLCFSMPIFAMISADDIAQTMEKKINKATDLIRLNKNQKDKISGEIYKIFDPVFDYELMAKLSLGFKQYKSLSKNQQGTFLDEFQKRLKNSFKDSLGLYSDEKVVIAGMEKSKNGKILKTKLVGSQKTYEVDYKFYESKTKGWLIYDVSIQSVSIVQSYRNQFANILEDKGFKKLIDMLKVAKIDIKN